MAFFPLTWLVIFNTGSFLTPVLEEKHREKLAHVFFCVGFLSCHSTNSVKALRGTSKNYPLLSFCLMCDQTPERKGVAPFTPACEHDYHDKFDSNLLYLLVVY